MKERNNAKKNGPLHAVEYKVCEGFEFLTSNFNGLHPFMMS